jgi:hypothetical protein
MHNAPRIAIIGAGASGLMAASEAQHQGLHCTVFDKARRAGGRLASRRSDWGSFNHGAPYLSMPHQAPMPADPRLQCALSQNLNTLRLSSISGECRPALVPSDSINALAQQWKQGLTCHFQHTLCELKHDGDNWWLKFSEQPGWLGPFDRVLMTCPPVQALALLSKLPSQYALCQNLQTLHHAPCWSVRWVPQASPTLASGEFVREDLQSHGIALCIREDLRPQGGGAPRFTLHATPTWSAAHVEDSSEQAAQALMQAAATALDLSASAEYLDAHRWRYGHVTQAAGQPFLRGKNGLYYAGDACLGATAIDAMHSGLAAADALCAELLLTA